MEELFAADLARLCEALTGAASCSQSGERWRITADGTLPIEVTVAEAVIEVALAGWSQVFPIASGLEDDDLAEAESALDLIGAALFGEVRVKVSSVGGRALAWTLELREGNGWTEVRRVGGRSWNPFARRSLEVLVNRCPRPTGYAAIAVPTSPSAPWLGRAGFAGRPADEKAIEVPIDGVLDLHLHAPKIVGKLVPAYLEQCRARGVLKVRIIHGKGVGNLRRSVHALLGRSPHVLGFRIGGHAEGSWGATLVDLRPLDGPR